MALPPKLPKFGGTPPGYVIWIGAPDDETSGTTPPPRAWSQRPIVMVSAWAGVARKVASTRTSFFTGASPCPHPLLRKLQLAAFVAIRPKKRFVQKNNSSKKTIRPKNNSSKKTIRLK